MTATDSPAADPSTGDVYHPFIQGGTFHVMRTSDGVAWRDITVAQGVPRSFLFPIVAVDAAGGTVPLPDGRAVCTGRAEFDALLGGRRKRAWVTMRRNAPMPPRR